MARKQGRILAIRARLILVSAWEVLLDAIQRFAAQRAPEAAAGMAFYAIFGLFPLLLFLVTASSYVLEAHAARAQVLDFVNEWIPLSQELVSRNIEQVLSARGAFGVVAAATLLWSASGFFVTLARQVNKVWPHTPARSAIQRRLLALFIVICLAALVGLGYAANRALHFVLGVQMPLADLAPPVDLAPLVRALVAVLLPWVAPFVILTLFYILLPNTRVSLLGAFTGAAAATVAWRIATRAFVWYLGSGFSRYHLVYGSLASVIALLFWIYVTNIVILFGAHLTESASRRR